MAWSPLAINLGHDPAGAAQPLSDLGATVAPSSARLDQVEKLLEAILQAGSDAIVVIDARHSVVLANQAAVRTFGRPADEMAGAGVSLLLTPDTFARYLAQREMFEAGLAATEPRQPVMGWGRRADGSSFRISGTLMLFSDAPGRRFCTLVVRAVGMDHETAGQRAMSQDVQGVLVQEAESRQAAIGRELHDGVASSLTGVNLLLARARSSALPAEAARLIRAAQEQVVVAMQHVRRLSRGIMPAGQDDGALVPALEMFAADMNRLPGIRCLIACRGEFADVSGEVGGHLVRIVQEATNNALRHGGARRIRIMLVRLEEQCRLTITDDGKGCDPRGLSGPVAGMGIRSMRARAKAIGGVFTATPRPGRGVRVRVTWSAAKPLQTVKP